MAQAEHSFGIGRPALLGRLRQDGEQRHPHRHPCWRSLRFRPGGRNRGAPAHGRRRRRPQPAGLPVAGSGPLRGRGCLLGRWRLHGAAAEAQSGGACAGRPCPGRGLDSAAGHPRPSPGAPLAAFSWCEDQRRQRQHRQRRQGLIRRQRRANPDGGEPRWGRRRGDLPACVDREAARSLEHGRRAPLLPQRKGEERVHVPRQPFEAGHSPKCKEGGFYTGGFETT